MPRMSNRPSKKQKKSKQGKVKSAKAKSRQAKQDKAQSKSTHLTMQTDLSKAAKEYSDEKYEEAKKILAHFYKKVQVSTDLAAHESWSKSLSRATGVESESEPLMFDCAGNPVGSAAGKLTDYQNRELLHVRDKYRPMHCMGESEPAELVPVAISPTKYKPELYEAYIDEEFKRMQWTLEATERGSTIVVDPVEDLVRLLRALEATGVVDVTRSDATESGFTLTVVVDTDPLDTKNPVAAKSEPVEAPTFRDTEAHKELRQQLKSRGLGTYIPDGCSDKQYHEEVCKDPPFLQGAAYPLYPLSSFKGETTKHGVEKVPVIRQTMTIAGTDMSNEAAIDTWHGIPLNEVKSDPPVTT